MIDFAELHCLSNYSFLRSASHPEELVVRAAQLGYRGLALTDECSVAGVVKAWQAIQQYQLDDFKLIIGSEFRLKEQLIVLICPTQQAYSELCQLITKCRRRSEKGHYQLQQYDLRKIEHCFCLWIPAEKESDFSFGQALYDSFKERLWLSIENLLTNHSDQYVSYCQKLAAQLNLKLVCSNHVLMHIPERKELHDALTAIRLNCSIEQAMPALLSNAENHLRSLKKIQHIYQPEWISESWNIAIRCEFKLDSLSYRYPRDCVPGQYSAEQYLRILIDQGIKKRFPKGIDDELQSTIEKELTLIRKKDYEHYFLTVYDIVRFARSKGILCQGRGSAANSVVCYCLGITEVNPQEATLLFERFISESRDDPPDIDVDFEHERREEVIQYLYRRYGRKRAALAATVITYRRKSALRDIGKALGLDIDQMNQRIANYGWRYRSENWVDEIINDGLGLSEQRIQLFKQLLHELIGFPRHLSQHVGGFVLSEGKIADLVPIENASMTDRTVIQWDKDDLEALGLMKVDILALGMLSAVQKALHYINDFHQTPLRIQDIPREDPDVYQMIQKADTVGVFQIESRAQMNMLPRLKPVTYYDLVIQVAIVRPGPIHGDMVHPYLRRRSGQETVNYPKEELRPILERTLGVPIFQEQVIALAMVAAGFTADEGNSLRKSMASWRKKGHISELRERLTNQMLANGYPLEFIERINRQIEGFGEYGFPESHAAGFALIAYVSSWLKYHYPAAFCCALLNSLPMGFYSASQLIQDVQRHNVKVLPVNINQSEWFNTLENRKSGTAIRLGFSRIKGLPQSVGEQLAQQRPDTGYSSLQQIKTLNHMAMDHLESLASSDALKGITGHRFQTRWETLALQEQGELLEQSYRLDQIHLPTPNELEELVQDQQTLGLSVNHHLIEILRRDHQLPDTPLAIELLAIAKTGEQEQRHKPNYDGKVRIPIAVCGLIVNRQRPHTKAGVTFITLEDHTGNINVIVWLNEALTFMRELTTETLVLVKGVLEKAEDSDVLHVIAQQIVGMNQYLGGFEVRSRDYH